MKKALAILLFSVTLVGGTAAAAFAKNGADDGTTGRIDCRNHDTVCVAR